MNVRADDVGAQAALSGGASERATREERADPAVTREPSGLSGLDGILRVFRFRPRRSAFDAVLRHEVLADVASLPGVRSVLLARRGPGDTGERLIASRWESVAAMEAGLGSDPDDPRLRPERAGEIEEARLEFGRVRVGVAAPVEGPASVVRLAHGRTRSGAFEAYVAQAHEGTLDDIRSGHGPRTLVLASLGDDRFVTLSAWDSWTSVEAATGGSYATPRSTRHAELLAEWDVEHYEVVAEIDAVAGTPHAPDVAPILRAGMPVMSAPNLRVNGHPR